MTSHTIEGYIFKFMTEVVNDESVNDVEFLISIN